MRVCVWRGRERDFLDGWVEGEERERGGRGEWSERGPRPRPSPLRPRESRIRVFLCPLCLAAGPATCHSRPPFSIRTAPPSPLPREHSNYLAALCHLQCRVCDSRKDPVPDDGEDGGHSGERWERKSLAAAKADGPAVIVGLLCCEWRGREM